MDLAQTVRPRHGLCQTADGGRPASPLCIRLQHIRTHGDVHTLRSQCEIFNLL